MTHSTTGIASIGLALPPLALDVRELAALRGVDPDKYTRGLGCDRMAVCPPDYGVADLMERAAQRALARWDGDRSRLGLLAVGTESALDMSRPLSAWAAERLGLRGALRSYEVKHACYGGTLALRQALEWHLAGAGAGRAALVIAADVARYAPRDPGEPTGGAGAVAWIVDADAAVASIDARSYAYSNPVFDFWRPVGEAYPRVDGPLSLRCYNESAIGCFDQLVDGADAQVRLAEFSSVSFHVPFPKMVRKAVAALATHWGWDDATQEAFWRDRVDMTMRWNRIMGNAYTASLWFSVAAALAGAPAGQRALAFSYGSGCGAELLALTAGPACAAAAWTEDVAQDMRERRDIGAAEYERLRAAERVVAAAA